MKFIIFFICTLFVFESIANAKPKQGEISEDNMTYLYRENVEMYWNDWSGKSLNQNKIYISGEGKTATFDGILELNCESSSGYDWVTASTRYSDFKTKESELKSIVPIQVISAAFEEFCTEQ